MLPTLWVPAQPTANRCPELRLGSPGPEGLPGVGPPGQASSGHPPGPSPVQLPRPLALGHLICPFPRASWIPPAITPRMPAGTCPVPGWGEGREMGCCSWQQSYARSGPRDV